MLEETPKSDPRPPKGERFGAAPTKKTIRRSAPGADRPPVVTFEDENIYSVLPNYEIENDSSDVNPASNEAPPEMDDADVGAMAGTAEASTSPGNFIPHPTSSRRRKAPPKKTKNIKKVAIDSKEERIFALQEMDVIGNGGDITMDDDDEEIPELMDTDDEEDETAPPPTKAPRHSDKLFSINLAPTGVWITGNIGGNCLPIAIDTCSNYNLVNLKYIRDMNLTMKDSDVALKGAGGAAINILGYVNLTVTVAREKFRAKFYVLKNLNGALIGLSTMEEVGISVDAVTNVVSVRGSTTAYTKRPRSFSESIGPVIEEELNNIRIVENVIIPSNRHFIVAAAVQNSENINGEFLEVDPHALRIRHGLLCARVLVKKDSLVPINIFNPMPRPMKLLRNTVVGTARSCEVITEEPLLVPSDDPDVVDDDAEDSGYDAESADEAEIDPHPLDKIKLDHLAGEERKEVEKVLSRYPECFARHAWDLGLTPLMEYKLDLKPGEEAPAVEPQRTMPLHKREAAEKAVEEMLEAGVIEESTSEWRTFPVLVDKVDPLTGERQPHARFCIDFRALNRKCTTSGRTIARVNDVLDAMRGAKYFSSIDLNSAYHQVSLRKKDRPLTSFSLGFGSRQLQFKRLTFGLKDATQAYGQLMELVLSGLLWHVAIAYIDDLYVFSRDFRSHKRDVGDVLARLKMANLKAKPSKCQFFMRNIVVLGHQLGTEGVSPDSKKIVAVSAWPRPSSVTEVKSFVAFCNYFRRFVKGFSIVAAPLTKLTKKDIPWAWEAEQENAFNTLKRLLTTAPILRLPEIGKPFILESDFSKQGMGWILLQRQDNGEERPILYGSKSLSGSERSYGATKGEFTAMFEAISRCRHLLLGAEFTCRVDHKCLSYLQNFRDLTGRTARMLEVLADYGDFTIEYKPGKNMGAADALSRINWKDVIKHTDVVMPTFVEPIDWKLEQSKDPDLKTLSSWLSTGVKPSREYAKKFSVSLRSYWASFSQFELENGIIYRKWVVENDLPDIKLKLVPDHLKRTVLQLFHEEAGHMGSEKMSKLMRHAHYWYSMSKDARVWTESCGICRRRRRVNTRVPLVQDAVSYCREKQHIDIKGPLKETSSGNKYYCAVIDAYSKWVTLFPLQNREASTVWSGYFNFCYCAKGSCVTLHSDQEVGLNESVAKELFDYLVVKKTRTSGYRPESNGQAERGIRTSLEIMSKLIAEGGGEWDKLLPKIALVMNTTVSSTTGMTPFFIEHGCEAILPADLILDNLPPRKDVGASVRDVKETHERIAREIRKQTGEAQRRQKKGYDVRIKGEEIDAGDTVMFRAHILNPGELRTLRKRFQEPLYTVTQKLSEANYKIKSPIDQSERIVHYNNILKVQGPDREAVPNLQEMFPPAGAATSIETVQESPEVRRSTRERNRPRRLDDYNVDSIGNKLD